MTTIMILMLVCLALAAGWFGYDMGQLTAQKRFLAQIEEQRKKIEEQHKLLCRPVSPAEFRQ